MKNFTYWLFPFVRNSIFQLLLITALTSSCTKSFYPEVSIESPPNEESIIDFELLNEMRNDPNYKEILEVNSESYKKNYIDSILASTGINDSTSIKAHGDYIIHLYVLIDKYITSYPKFDYRTVARHVTYDLMERERITRTQIHIDDTYVNGDENLIRERAKLFIGHVHATVDAGICRDCYITGRSTIILQAYATHLQNSMPPPYSQVISNINFATSRMTMDIIMDPMMILDYDSGEFCWDELDRKYRSFNGAGYVASLHMQLCRNPADAVGGGSGGAGLGNQSIDRSNKELCDPEKFVDYEISLDCYEGCKLILRNYGLTEFGSPTAVFQLLDGNSNKSGLILYEIAIKCIDMHLNYDRPIIVGIDYEPGSGNHDGITDHFVVITGRGYDYSTRLYYYTYMETGANGGGGYNTYTNRLFFDPITKDFYNSNPKIGPRYDVTHVRPNSGDIKGTTSQLN